MEEPAVIRGALPRNSRPPTFVSGLKLETALLTGGRPKSAATHSTNLYLELDTSAASSTPLDSERFEWSAIANAGRNRFA